MIKVDKNKIQIEGDEVTIMSEINIILHTLKNNGVEMHSFSSVIFAFMKRDLCKEEREEFLQYLKLLINTRGFKIEGEEND